MKDELGSYIKENYENRYRILLPRKTYVILRLDGKAWHSWTRGLQKPYDLDLMEDIDSAAIKLIEQIQNAVFGYLQSDEYSILLYDANDEKTEAWFDNNLNKIVSVSSSIFTAEFNKMRIKRAIKEDNFNIEKFKLSYFDSRAFIIPNKNDIIKYFEWRNLDCTRNSINSAARSLFSHKQLQNKNSKEMQEMMWSEKNINFNDYPAIFKSGRIVIKETKPEIKTFTHKKTGEVQTVDIERNEWVVKPSPIFSRDKDFLENLIM